MGRGRGMGRERERGRERVRGRERGNFVKGWQNSVVF